MPPIPILRPRLPSATRIAPYLSQIDATRYYTNFGPLVCSLEERLAEAYGVSVGALTTVANATLGLELALSAQGARPGTLCLMPAWTFIASAHAAVRAGLVPYFVDVDACSWALEVDAIDEAIGTAPGEVGAIMPVAPFGQPIDLAAWDRFAASTGLPVVIDAAAGFDTLAPGVTPAVVSLHATKVLGVGEGGFVVSRDSELIRGIRARSNFGFDGSRQAIASSTNAKLSEYHAAVGLAAFDEWDTARSEWIAVAKTYRSSLDGSNHLRFQPGFGESWITSTCVLGLPEAAAGRVEQALAVAGIETRRWWGRGAHAHLATASLPRRELAVTEGLAEATIAVPFFRDIPAAEVQRIGECLHVALSA